MRVVGGRAKGRRLTGPVVPGVRATTERVRSAIFNILDPQVYAGKKVLDLYAGSGSLGIEALSRGGEWVDFVELDRRQSRVIQSNLLNAGLAANARVHCGDVNRILDSLAGPYFLVLLDPPYRLADLGELLGRMGAMTELVPEGGIVVAGHSRRLILDDEYGSLNHTSNRRYGDNVVDFFRRVQN